MLGEASLISQLKYVEKKIAFFYTQRCGSTVLCTWFFKELGLYEEAMTYSGWIHDYEWDIFSHSVIDVCTDDYYKVFLVRNPFARAVSSYFAIMNSEYVNILPERNCSILDFFKAVRIGTIPWGSGDMQFGGHVEPQIKDRESLKMIDRIIKVEDNVQAQMNDLVDKFSLKERYPESQSSSHRMNVGHFSEKRDWANLKWLDILNLTGETFPHHTEWYSDNELIKIVGELYCVDLAELGYNFDNFNSHYNVEQSQAM